MVHAETHKAMVTVSMWAVVRGVHMLDVVLLAGGGKEVECVQHTQLVALRMVLIDGCGVNTAEDCPSAASKRTSISRVLVLHSVALSVNFLSSAAIVRP